MGDHRFVTCCGKWKCICQACEKCLRRLGLKY